MKLHALDGQLPVAHAHDLPFSGARGDMDQAITIRTLVFNGDEFSYQAGAGIVADSRPEAEHDEILAKSASAVRALKLAEAGL